MLIHFSLFPYKRGSGHAKAGVKEGEVRVQRVAVVVDLGSPQRPLWMWWGWTLVVEEACNGPVETEREASI
jgi:hypothetical protein